MSSCTLRRQEPFHHNGTLGQLIFM